MESGSVIAQVFWVQGQGHTKVVSISPGYKTIWAIPVRAFAGNPGSGSMQFIPQVESELLGAYTLKASIMSTPGDIDIEHETVPSADRTNS